MQNTRIEVHHLEASELLGRIDNLENAIKALHKAVTNFTPSQLLTRKEVSEMMGVSTVTLSKWHHKGILTRHKVGSRVRYKYEDIQTLLNTQTKLTVTRR